MSYSRNFNPADMDEVERIFLSELDEIIPPSDILTFSALWPRGQFVACEPSGRIIGALFGTMEDGKARIMAIAVEERHTRKGVASGLLESFMAEAVTRGAGTIILEVRPGNRPAHEFYKKKGFTEKAYLENHYSDGGPCIVMVAPAARFS